MILFFGILISFEFYYSSSRLCVNNYYSMKLLFSIFLCFTQILVSAQLSTDPFGTKTSYFKVANNNEEVLQVDGCSPAVFWILARHGTRNPGDEDILMMEDELPRLRDEIVTAWQEGRGSMREEDIIRMIEWSFDLSIEDENILTKSGHQEHQQMGSRWRSRLGDFITDTSRY